MSEGTPRTWFAGKSAPEDQKGPSLGTVSAIIMLVLSPLGAIIAIAGYAIAFSMVKLSWKVIAGTAAAYSALWVLFGGLSQGALRTYFKPWRDIIGAVKDGTIGGGVLYRVEPVGDLEPDEDLPGLDISFQVPKAKVIAVIDAYVRRDDNRHAAKLQSVLKQLER